MSDCLTVCHTSTSPSHNPNCHNGQGSRYLHSSPTPSVRSMINEVECGRKPTHPGRRLRPSHTRPPNSLCPPPSDDQPPVTLKQHPPEPPCPSPPPSPARLRVDQRSSRLPLRPPSRPQGRVSPTRWGPYLQSRTQHLARTDTPTLPDSVDSWQAPLSKRQEVVSLTGSVGWTCYQDFSEDRLMLRAPRADLGRAGSVRAGISAHRAFSMLR
jgi:hypothetical protein